MIINSELSRKVVIGLILVFVHFVGFSQGFNPGTIGNNQTIYSRTAPAALTFISPPSGGSGPYTYQWQRSDDSGATFYNPPSSNQAVFTSSTLSKNTLFRCRVTDGSALSLYTNTVTITIWKAGVIGNNQIIVRRTAPQPLIFTTQPTGGSLPFTYQWQQSIDNGANFNNVSGANYAFFSPGTLSRKTLFRCFVSDAANFNDYTNNVTIDIQSDMSAGTIGSSQNLCNGSVPSGLSGPAATGGTPPYTYQWQYSTSGSDWLTIAGATSTDFSPTGLTADTWYRRWVQDASGRALASNTVKITINPPVTSAQLHDNISIENNTSTTISIAISGGTPPYTINYTRNGVAQDPVVNYTSGSDISTGILTTGVYRFVLASVIDANGCSAQTLGTGITVTVNGEGVFHYDFTYADRANLLSDGWDFIARTSAGEPRNTEQVIPAAVVSYDQVAHPGVLSIPVDNGTLYGFWDNDTRNSIFRDLPSGWTSIRLKIASFNPSLSSQQAGLAVYFNDNSYILLTRMFTAGGTHRVNFIHETEENNQGPIIAHSINESATTDIHLRMDWNSSTSTLTSYYSLDGIAWAFAGDRILSQSQSQSVSNSRFGIIVGESPTGFPPADFEWAEISTQPLSPVVDRLSVQPRELVFNAVEGQEFSGTRSLFISTILGTHVNWTRSVNGSWLSTDLENGMTEGALEVGINTGGLEAGIHNGTIILQSSEISGDPVTIPVILIVNPNVPVKATTWRDGRDGAMSVSVDDGVSSGYVKLQSYGFSGTYVYYGLTPPADFQNGNLFNAGMELGSHLVSHYCSYIPNNNLLRSQEIEPNISGLCSYTPQPCKDVISLVYPCGNSNYRSQAVASEYFLSARGYNINLLEDANPVNFMNLKSFNTIGDPVPPPTDNLITFVDMAIAQNKWFNLVLHYSENDGGAIDYAATQNIWVSSIGSVTKYILQRERFILTDYSTSTDLVTFNVSRSPVASSVYRSFETAFNPNDVTTLEIDIDNARTIENVYVDGVANPYQIINLSGNFVLRTNVRLEPSVVNTVVINYVPLIGLGKNDENGISPILLQGEIRDKGVVLNWKSSSDKNIEKYLIYKEYSPISDLNVSKPFAETGESTFIDNYAFDNSTLFYKIRIQYLDKTLSSASNEISLQNSEKSQEEELPQSHKLYQNYPNPFNTNTLIEYDLSEDAFVILEVYNSFGQKIETVLSQNMHSGNYKVDWNSSKYPAGVYYLTMKTGIYRSTIRMSLLK